MHLRKEQVYFLYFKNGMIISHKHKFIFIKPTKVAGTSIEINIAKYCGEQDIITPITAYSTNNDSSFYEHNPRNYLGFYNHMPPNEIKTKIGSKIWNDYFKFTVTRNPWDVAVSRYFWSNFSNKKTILKIFLNLIRRNNFKEFIREYPREWTNERFYFDENGDKICDFYIKYEDLEDDYLKVCKILNLPYEKLPKTKDKLRKVKNNYSIHYDRYLREIIEQKFKKEINQFEYKFK